MNNFTFSHSLLYRIYIVLAITAGSAAGTTAIHAQCDAEVSGVFTYCNSFHDGNPVSGYFVAFRVKDLTGDTLNVIDINGVVPTNQGKRVDDINTEDEPDDYSVQQLMISDVGADTLEFWYFGPYPNGSSFDIALVDPNNVCDTIFVASGSFDCADNTGTSDPGACDADVPLYFLDFSQTEFVYGGGGGGNESFDDVFLIMARTRENFCCDLQPANQRCFEFIIRLADQDIGLTIDDVGSGSTGGEFYADTLNAFACTGNSAMTWPFTQSGGQSSDLPLCLGFEGQEFVVLSCKSGANVTGASIDAISNIFSPPQSTIEPCNVTIEVFNADSITWSSPDDPTLANLISCTPDSNVCMFFYDTLTFGEVTACEGDTFTYIVGGMPAGNECFGGDTLLYDTTYVIVFPVFTVEIDSTCTGDSLTLTAIVSSPAIGCDYDIAWSTGDSTQSITVAISSGEYFVSVTRSDLPDMNMCVIVTDSITAEGSLTIDCSQITDTLYSCVIPPPDPDTSLVLIGGCGTNVLVFNEDVSNGGTGCQTDTLIITRYYIIDFDGDTVATMTDRDTCTQLLSFVDDIGPIITCPANITVSCNASTMTANTGNATATDNCDATPIVFFTDITVAGGCPQEFTINRTFGAMDDCGNSSTCLQVIFVDDSSAPSITCPANTTIQCSASTLPANTGTAIGTDNCDGTPTFTFTDVSVAGGCPQEYTITRTWRATDDCGNSSTCNQIIVLDDSTPPSITCPVNTTIQCSASTLPANTGIATATDNCDGTLAITSSDVTVGGSCPQEYTITRTWRAADDCGNSSSCTQIIFVDDSTSPLITCPANTTIQCTASTLPANTGTATATDNCDGSPTITSTDVTVSGICPQEYTISRTWRATDDCGNSSSCLQVITIDDSAPPILTCPANITVSCNASTMTANTGNATATDNCDATPIIFFNDITIAGSCPQEFTINRTFGAMDDCGNSSTCLQVIIVDDSNAPTITCPANITIQCSASTLPANTGTATGTDNCDGTPTFTFTDVSIAGGCPQEYTITRTWRATDDCGNSSTCNQIIVLDDSTPPSITCPVNTTIQCTASTLPANTGTATATDNCDGTPAITFSDVTVGGSCPQEYTITRTWRATDDCGNSSSCNQIIFVDDSTSPLITCPANTTIQCTASTLPANTGTATATDNCDGSPTITSTDVTVGGICPQEFTISRTWRAIDDCGNSSSCLQVITIDDSAPPILTCPANITVSCNASTMTANTGNATATDNCDATPIIFFNDITIAGSCPQEFTINRTFGAMDDCGNSSTCLQVIFVDDSSAPSITCPANTTIQCTASTLPANTGTATGTDNCDGTPTFTFTDVSVAGGCPQEYTITRTWRATDDCGNSSTCNQIIVLDDSTPPVITCPVNTTIQCTASTLPANTGTATATDNCDGTPAITFSDVTVGGSCPQEYTITRTWRATDDCGNSSSCNQIIFVDDSTSPLITCPANTTIQCTASTLPANTGIATASDNCDGSPTITSTDVTVSGICPQEYTINRTWRATDDCGNSSTCIQIIQLDDSVAPTITCPNNVTIQCNTSTLPAATGTATASDNCDGTPAITSTDVTIAGVCPQEFTINRTWRATDDCGNSSTCLQIIVVDDSIAPTITCPGNVTNQCNTSTLPAATGTATASDNCDVTPSITSTDVTIAGGCPQEFTINRTWRATDDCGNSSSCLQTIVVDDSQAPGITCPADITIDIEESTFPANTGNPTASDNCDGTPAITFTDVTTQGACSNEYIISRTFLATDDCGNSATCIQVINVTGGCIVDLSLIKELDPNQGPVSGGDNVNFIITVSNDGEQDISSVTIIDYIPIGFSLNDPDWTPGNQGSTGQSATITLSIVNGGFDANGLNPGETVTVGITLQADLNIPGGVYYNTAEILTVININGEDVTVDDIDSTPDSNDANDPDAEDDHDIVEICIQPVPVIVGDTYVCPEELVLYSIENPNPNNTYEWTLSGGGTIVEDNGTSILVQWQITPGGSFQLTVVESGSSTCQGSAIILVFIQGVEPIACNDLIQISLDEDGSSEILPGMILEGENENNNNYYVVITDQDGNVIPNATVNCSHIGQTLMVSVHNICNNQSCWGLILVEDKLPPQIVCECPVGNAEPECEVNCLQVELLEDGIIPPDLYPTVIDNCPDVSVSILDIDVNDEGCGGGFIIVTWKATDIGGNMATCTQQFSIIPLTLDSLTFPSTHEGECHTSVHPSVTGWPQIDGLDLQDNGGICNIFTGYWDKELNDCGGGRKIQRTWTVLDWCTQDIVEGVQIIKLSDTEGPVLDCPNDVTVGTDFWYCYANFSVPKPQVYDACSEIESFILIASAGTVVYFGNNAVINNLPIGTHQVTWIVADECGNSSTCSFDVTVEDDVVPVANCDQHTIVSLTNDGPHGITLVPATVFDDGSYDNCGPVTFRARRMDSCIDFDWTTEGACIDHIPGGVPPVNSRDRGTVQRPCVPFSCCDVGAGPIMVELEVTDAAGNVNYCMIEVTVQDKISPFIVCPPDIIVSCDFWFAVEEGTFVDTEGNNDGSLDEDPLTPIFGNMFDAARYNESIRGPISIFDPGNTDFFQPNTWGIDGWADDNCEVDLQVRVRVLDDCSGHDLPANAPPHAVKLIERRFTASGTNDGSAPATCTQRIWVVDFNPFYISDQTCNNINPNDGVIWPCDVVLSDCPDDVSGTGVPIIFDDACSLIGVSYEDTRFEFVDGACFKILRDWAVIDWCQYNTQTGEGLWHYVQVIKVHDEEGPVFQDCAAVETLCVSDPGVSLPDNNQVFLGESNPQSTSCSVHLDITKTVYEPCSPHVKFDVKIYLFNGPDFMQVHGITTSFVDSNGYAALRFNTRESPIQAIRLNGLPYNSPFCNNFHRILWSVEDGCGNWSHCEYLLRLEDCKQPTPVCINGLSTVVMPVGGQVTIWAKDFNASSVDDCTPADELLYSFSGDAYQPSFTFTCDNVPAFGVELVQNIWVADSGVDHNCNGQIEWSERNKDYCTTTIVIMDNTGVCDQSGSILAGEILTPHEKAVEKVKLTLTNPGHVFPIYITGNNGLYRFIHVPANEDYVITPERTDNARNGVSTLDLVSIQKHLLGIQPFTSPYQYIAADASNNQSVSAIDLIEIRKVILGINTVFPYNTSWRFVEKGFPIDQDHPWPFGETIAIASLTADSMTSNDFVAVKIGDVNNSAQANAAQVMPRNGNQVMHVITPEQVVNEEELIDATFTLPANVSGWQWTLEAEGLELIDVSSSDITIGDEHIAMLREGIVTMSWNADVAAAQKENGLITMHMTWRATKAGMLSQMLSLTSRVTQAEAYSVAGEIMDVNLSFAKAGATGFALYQNQPNPWHSNTVIGFDLPVADDAVLTVYDIAGKEVIRFDGSYKAGSNTIELAEKQLPAQGVLYYRLESGAFASSKKMILIR